MRSPTCLSIILVTTGNINIDMGLYPPSELLLFPFFGPDYSVLHINKFYIGQLIFINCYSNKVLCQ